MNVNVPKKIADCNMQNALSVDKLEIKRKWLDKNKQEYDRILYDGDSFFIGKKNIPERYEYVFVIARQYKKLTPKVIYCPPYTESTINSFINDNTFLRETANEKNSVSFTPKLREKFVSRENWSLLSEDDNYLFFKVTIPPAPEYKIVVYRDGCENVGNYCWTTFVLNKGKAVQFSKNPDMAIKYLKNHYSFFIDFKMSKEEFLNAAEKCWIPSEWYSFEKDLSKPVYLQGTDVHYNKVGCIHCNKGTEYEIMLKQLLKYKRQFKCFESNEIYPIEINIFTDKELGSLSAKYVGKGKWCLSLYSYKNNDEDFISKGYNFSHFDRYNNEYIYKRTVNEPPYKTMQIYFKKRTSNNDRRVFGFKEDILSGDIALTIPKNIYDMLIHYIKQADDNRIHNVECVQSICKKIGYDRIVKYEFKELFDLNKRLRKALYNELKNQKQTNSFSPKDEKKLEETFRVNTADKYIRISYFNSRRSIIERCAFEEAKKIFYKGSEITDEELEAYREQYFYS